MMPVKRWTYLWGLMMLILCNKLIAADSTGMVRFNLKNGLPSNHVYHTMQDRNGYMWFATDNGVVKYDGYNFKIFNTSNGLPSSDVWHLTEDGMGRIWLYMYAYELGYIKNDKYYRIWQEYGQPVKLVDVEYTGGTTYLKTTRIIVVDGLNDIIFSGKKLSNSNLGDLKLHIHINDLDNYVYDLRSLRFKREYPDPLLHEHKRIYSDSIITLETGYANSFSIYNINSDSLYLFSTLFSKGEKFVVPIFDRHIHILTNKYWYIVSPEKKKYIIKDFKKLLHEPDVQLTNIEYDALHNTWLSSSKGVYMQNNYSGINSLLTLTSKMNGHRYAGYTNNAHILWWNSEAMRAVLTDSDNKVIARSPIIALWPGFTIGNDTSIYMETAEHIINWNSSKNQLKTLTSSKSRLSLSGIPSYAMFTHNLTTVFQSPYLFESSVGNGIHYAYIGKDSLQKVLLKEGRYDKVINDTLNQWLWYYNKNAIFILRPADRKSIDLDKSLIDQLGLGNISSLNIDRFGNLFIHHANELSIFNLRTLEFKRINTNIVLTNAFVATSKDHLFIANESGLAVAPINGLMNVGSFRIALNVKDKSYTKVNNLLLNVNTIILQTDEGTYSTTVSQLLNTDLLDVSDKRLMQLVVHTPDAYNLNRTDTFSISDSTNRVRVDMINLYGKGTKSYFYNIDNAGWQSSTSGELFFPGMKPGYHTIQCYGTDELWKSNVSTFYLYKQPYWYQTTKWKTIFWISGIILFLGIVLIVVLITRYLVQRANDKKRQTLELELRAIHSQINPHFIFNTLGTALFFISKRKLDEAYQHVHKFSRLLRSYLKASHDRYTLLSDEIEMLRNYIELQQIRFEEKVDYNIEIDNKIPAGSIMVPSLLFQPLVENAINHGLFHLEDGRKGKLDISFKPGKDNNEIICIIEDNGVGRKRAKELKEQSELKRDSYGTKLTQDLIDIFSEYESMDIYIEYTDKEAPETGTIVTLTIRNLKYIA